MVLLNSAGASASDPILKGLGEQWVISSPSMDVATVSDAWIDQAAGFPGTTSVKSNLSPAASVVSSGNSAAFNDTTDVLTLASTTGLSVGDWLYLSGGSVPVTGGIYQIATIPNSTTVTLVGNPLNGGGDRTGIAYQVAWRWDGVAGTAPLASSVGGQANYFKAELIDSQANVGQLSEIAYIRDAPAGASYIDIGGQNYVGATTNSATPTFNLLAGWSNRGGVSHVELINHSVQAANQFRWGDGTASEKTLAAALAGGFSFSPSTQGIKYGRLRMKSKTAGAIFVEVDLSITVDSSGPTIRFDVFGR